MTTPTVLLFDVDGTLLDSGGAGRRSMLAAFEACHRRPDACAGFSFGGMTDRAIIRRALRSIDAATDDDALDAVLAAYLAHLRGEAQKPGGARLLPGVTEALAHVEGRPGVAVGLGTGNVEEGARIKLRMVGLSERFSFGGFGCDAEDRAALLRAGARRGAASLGVAVEGCRVVVIGDTPLDIEAARRAGASCVAVSTGGFSADELRAHAPDMVCARLTDPAALSLLVG